MAEKQHKGKRKWLICLIFWIYMGVMIYFLFLGDRYGNPYHEYHYNLTLFQEIRRFIIYREHVGTASFLMNVFGNVFAFSPFGFFLPLLLPKMRSWRKVLLLSFELTFFIECVQLVTKLGVFDVDDLCMNTFGGLTGYWIYLVVQSIFRTLKKEKK